MKFIFSAHAWDDPLYWQVQDRKLLDRINALIKQCAHTVHRNRKAGAVTRAVIRVVVATHHAGPSPRLPSGGRRPPYRTAPLPLLAE